MDNFILTVMANLMKLNQFDLQQLEAIKMALITAGKDYKVEHVGYLPVTEDFFKPAGYEEYFASKIMAGIAIDTVNMYKYQVDNFLMKVKKPLKDITGQDIALYIYNKRVNDGNSEVTANNTRRYLSAFFIWLFNNGYIDKNISMNVAPIKEPYRKKDTIDADGFERIMAACKSQRDRAMIAVAAGSGIRRGEISGLLRKDLDMHNSSFTVIGKGNKERTCFLTPRAKHELEEYLKTRVDDSPYVFISGRNHTQISVNGINYIMSDIGKRAGMRFHPHMLRHFFADSAHDASIDILDISRMLGHASVSTTQIYIKENISDLAYKHSRLR